MARVPGAHPSLWCGRGLIVVVEQDCIGCEGLLRSLEDRSDGALALPAAALSKSNEPGFGARLSEFFSPVVTDREGIEEAGLLVTPFVMSVDGELRIRSKQITGNVRGVAKHVAEGEPESQQLALTKRKGRT